MCRRGEAVDDGLMGIVGLFQGERGGTLSGLYQDWLSPFRRLEDDVSAASYEPFRGCTAALERLSQ